MIIAFNKPYNVISQFTQCGKYHTLAEFSFPKNTYPLGRLDADSEGLLLLSDEAGLNSRLLHPLNAHSRTYWVQIDGLPTNDELQKLQSGLVIADYTTLPCSAKIIETPNIHERMPPIRYRKTIPTSWIELKLTEGKNRQVRRMTAAVGHPTLRLIRVAIGSLTLEKLVEGEWRIITETERNCIFTK